MSAAFTASFLPSRHSSRASGFIDAPFGSGSGGAAFAHSIPESLPFTVSSQPRTLAASSVPAQAPAPQIAPPQAAIGTLEGSPASPAFVVNTPQASSVGPALATATSQNPRLALPAQPASTPQTATPVCDTSQSQLYCVYTVQPGDTLSSIAVKMGVKGNDDVAPWDLLIHSNKPDIVDEDDLLQIGQKIRIPVGGAPVNVAVSPRVTPTASGGAARPIAAAATSPSIAGSVIHTVLSAQNVSDIAEQYDVTSQDVVNANKLANPDALAIGQELLIPNPKRFAKPAPPPAAPPVSAASSGAGAPSSSGSTARVTGPTSRAGLQWPVSGRISSQFGPSHPLGIDVDLYNNPNAPIAAAKAGKVTFAGGNTCCSYGLYVVVDHGDGLTTLYAHLSKINVSVGQQVSQGTVVGLGGRTGYATGNHLHFEVHQGGSVVNPMSYLP